MYEEPPIFLIFDMLFNKLDIVIDYYEKKYKKKSIRTLELKTRKLYTIFEVDEEDEENEDVVVEGFVLL